MRRTQKKNLKLILAFQAILWILFVAFMEHLWLEIILFSISMISIILFFIQKRYARKLSLFLNPYLLLFTFSFFQGSISTFSGEPKLIFVNYEVDEGLFPEINPEILHRVSIDPDYGWIDYMIALPNNMAVRLWSQQTGYLIDYRELSHIPHH